jgi:His-Xaa-Ser system radical SAM maturase HxsB
MINHFNFSKFKDKVLITNDFGRYLFLNKDEFKKFIEKKLDSQEQIYKDLVENHFILDRPGVLFEEELKDEIRSMKSYTLSGTSLHIFAITNSCNANCIYCQAKDKASKLNGFMTKETARKSVDIALQSPEKRITIEIQGGEPLLNFEVVKEIVDYTTEVKGDKDVSFTMVSNLIALDEEKVSFLVKNNVSVCTSLDGPQNVQEHNRVCKNGGSTYEYAIHGIEKLREAGIFGGAIQTTTKYSLSYPEEIVNLYSDLGLPGMFIRPLTPLGFAKSDWQEIGYTPEEFLLFYKKAFNRIMEINKQGKFFPELHASYFLRKILDGSSINYMELRSPCGAGIGQLSYYYTGDVYTCDEGRMISEAGIDAFKLGNVYKDSYEDLIKNPICKTLALSSVVESIPNCSDCVYNPYCGVCPVITYAHENDIFPKSPKGFRCQVYSGMMDMFFEILYKANADDLKVLESWLQN